MNSSGPMPLLVDPAIISNNASPEEADDVECISQIILRHPIATNSFRINPQLQTHPYDRAPPRTPPSVRLQVIPRHSAAEIPVIASLMNTVAQARDRKRQREEREYPRREVGQQTGPETVTPGRTFFERDSYISATKRLRREDYDDLPRPEISTESIGVNTDSTTPPLRTLRSGPVDPSTLDYPSTSSHQPSARSLARRRERDTPAARQARRERRERQQQEETIRLQLQQIEGLVPGSDHNCNSRCTHAQSIHQAQSALWHQMNMQPPSGPNAVSPTIAPGAYLRGHNHNLLPPLTAFPFNYSLPTYPSQSIPVQMLLGIYPSLPTPPPLTTLPIHAPVAVRPPIPPPMPPPQSSAFRNLYSFGNPSYPVPTYGVDYSHLQNYLFPSTSYGLSRDHMFAGLEIDLPIGASKIEIDSCTESLVYGKKEGDEDDDTCTVCLSNYEEGESIRKLPCNHVFHPDCIYKWLDINKKCPMCREDIDRLRS